MNRRLLLLGLLPGTVAFAVVACEDRCDPDQILVDDACHPKPAETTDSGTPPPPKTDAGAGDGSAGDAAPNSDSGGGAIDPGYGKVCTSDANCSGVAHYCAIPPASSQGYCTKTFTACPVPAGTCPPKWGCFDPDAMFGVSGFPAFCSKPP